MEKKLEVFGSNPTHITSAVSWKVATPKEHICATPPLDTIIVKFHVQLEGCKLN